MVLLLFLQILYVEISLRASVHFDNLLCCSRFMLVAFIIQNCEYAILKTYAKMVYQILRLICHITFFHS